MIKPLPFSTSEPLQLGTIYLLRQDNEKIVVTKGSAERKGLAGHWKVIKQFTNEVVNHEKV